MVVNIFVDGTWVVDMSKSSFLYEPLSLWDQNMPENFLRCSLKHWVVCPSTLG